VFAVVGSGHVIRLAGRRGRTKHTTCEKCALGLKPG
jgi:hypothetical protein